MFQVRKYIIFANLKRIEDYQMKKLIKKILYPILELLPETWCRKLKIICCVLSSDWRFLPPVADENPLRNVTDEEIDHRFAALDEESRMNAKKYILFHNLYSTPHPERYIVNFRGICEPSREKQRKEIQKHYHLENCNIYDDSALLYAHGLVAAPQTIQAYIKGKVFVDAGAFCGDSTLQLLHYSPCKIFAFEPSDKNRQLFVKTMSANQIPSSCFELIPSGLGEKKKKIQFEANLNGSSKVSIHGENIIEVTTLDSFFSSRDSHVGFIKADIEGMGLQMLQGAVEVLKRDRPVLSLSMYHSEEEFWGQYEFLQELKLNYRFRILLLHRGPVLGELTLWGVPEEVEAAI